MTNQLKTIYNNEHNISFYIIYNNYNSPEVLCGSSKYIEFKNVFYLKFKPKAFKTIIEAKIFIKKIIKNYKDKNLLYIGDDFYKKIANSHIVEVLTRLTSLTVCDTATDIPELTLYKNITNNL